MNENELGIKLVESAENASEKKKKKFFSGLRNRLIAMALAGFITLGVDWTKSISLQLGLEDKKESVREFIYEREITDDVLDDFRAEIKTKEPEFARLAEEYKNFISSGLNKLEKEIIGHELNSRADSEFDQGLINLEIQAYESGNYSPGNISETLTNDHQLISGIQSSPDFLTSNHDFFKKNLTDIFWCLALLNDSKDLRDAMVEFMKPPSLAFEAHASYGQNSRAITNSSISSGRWHSEVTIYPATFAGLDGRLSSNTYINIFIHELTHAITAGYANKKIDRKIGDDFGEVLDEGRTQSLTYKIVRYLNRDNPNLKPIFEESGGYDQYLIIAEIIESIARTHRNSDFMVDWQSGRIDYKTMLEHLQTSLRELNLSSNIYKQITEFRLGTSKSESSIKFLNNLLIELRLANVNLSDDFVRSILKREYVRH